MARSAFSDFLQVFPFWLFDVAPIEGLSLPIFNPLSGFTNITAPGFTFEMQDITEGNWHFRRKVIKKADVDAITLQRGTTFFDSDFWRWTVASLTGDTAGFQPRAASFARLSIGGPTPRRNLVLIQFFARNPVGPTGISNLANSAAQAGLVAANVGAIASNLPLLGGAVVSALGAGGFATGFTGGGPSSAFGPFEFTSRIPAKAWLLHDCLPTRYKTGSDFDARSGEVSIAEIELVPEMVEELSLAT